MVQEKPPVEKLSELTPGSKADFFALLCDKYRGVTRENKPYYHCRFRDGKRVVSFMVWSEDRWFDAAAQDWQVGHCYKIRGQYVEHERFGPQLVDITHLRAVKEEDVADGFDPVSLVETTRFGIEELWNELRQLAEEQLADPALRSLVVNLLQRHGERLKVLPLTRDRVYAYRGGLLEHVVSVTRITVQLAQQYAAIYSTLQPPLDRSLIIAGAILHELGKVREFDDNPIFPQPTLQGRLTGALVLGRDLLHEAAREIPELEPQRLQLLEHILLSPLYPAEGTGPRWAITPEGLLVQYADDLDLKMALYVHCLERDTGSGPFTERDPWLGRVLFKRQAL